MSLNNTAISVAPMHRYTHAYQMILMRLISTQWHLYSEMWPVEAVLHGYKQDELTTLSLLPQPWTIQLAGNDPKKLKQACLKLKAYGVKSVNLNVGCPSHKVQKGQFGAVLMKSPDHVAQCLDSMSSSNLKVSIKHRVGVDQFNSLSYLSYFIENIRKKSDCSHFIIHARRALLSNFSPKQNRKIPLLDYQMVKQIKWMYPDLRIDINGGIDSKQASDELGKVFDGCMIGRMAIEKTSEFIRFMNDYPINSNNEYLVFLINILSRYFKLLDKHVAFPLSNKYLSPLINILKGISGSSQWKKMLQHQMTTKQIDQKQILRFLESRLVNS
jgi:tRNA-dihydrouridine synthase A